MNARFLRIGLFVHPWHEYGRNILRGITRFAQDRDDWKLISDWPGGRIAPASAALDALILRPDRFSQVTAETGAELPRVLIGNDRDCGWADLCWDNPALGRLGAEHLLDQGHRTLAVVADPARAYQRERRDGFEAAVARVGLAAQRIEAVEDAALRRALGALAAPAGVLAVSDVLARSVLFAAEAIGRWVPEDVAVMGIGNDEVFCETTGVPLSSVALPGEDLGYQAAVLLARRLAGEALPAEPVPIPGRYVAVRRSTDLIAIDDPMVMRALRMIRDDRLEELTVAEVHRAIPLSRRALELRFRKVVGRPMRAELERVRIERARRLLRETDLSVGRVARAARFAGAGQMWRAFKRVDGLSPQAYRRTRGRP